MLSDLGEEWEVPGGPILLESLMKRLTDYHQPSDPDLQMQFCFDFRARNCILQARVSSSAVKAESSDASSILDSAALCIG